VKKKKKKKLKKLRKLFPKTVYCELFDDTLYCCETEDDCSEAEVIGIYKLVKIKGPEDF